MTYRAAEEIFAIARERAGQMSYQVAVQMLEIYNEQARRFPFRAVALALLVNPIIRCCARG